jgi:hypothetical protein
MGPHQGNTPSMHPGVERRVLHLQKHAEISIQAIYSQVQCEQFIFKKQEIHLFENIYLHSFFSLLNKKIL